MAAITITDVTAAGLADIGLAAANGGGDTIAYGTEAAAGWEEYSVLLVVRNGDASSHDVTVGSLSAVTVAAGKTAIIPVPNAGENAAAVAVTYSAVTSVTVAAVRILP